MTCNYYYYFFFAATNHCHSERSLRKHLCREKKAE